MKNGLFLVVLVCFRGYVWSSENATDASGTTTEAPDPCTGKMMCDECIQQTYGCFYVKNQDEGINSCHLNTTSFDKLPLGEGTVILRTMKECKAGLPDEPVPQSDVTNTTTSTTTTMAPTTTTTTTVTPPTTKGTTTTTTTPKTTPVPTTIPPTVPTTNATTAKPTLAPSPTPSAPTAAPKESPLHAGSFVAGIALTLGIIAIAFVGYKFYKARTERNYHTL